MKLHEIYENNKFKLHGFHLKHNLIRIKSTWHPLSPYPTPTLHAS